MVLKSLGILFLALLFLFIVFLIWAIGKWKKFTKSLEDNSVSSPSEIHLSVDLNPDWLTEEIKNEVSNAGFTIVKAYTIEEMPQISLSHLANSLTGLKAVLYHHPQLGNWYDLCAEDDSTEYTVSSAPQGEELDRRPNTCKEWHKGKSLQTLLARFEELTKETTLKSSALEDFRKDFEESYAKEMKWRNEKGGISQEEIERVAENMDSNLSPEVIEASYKELKQREIQNLHHEVITHFKNNSPLYEVKFAERYFILHDELAPGELPDYLAVYLNLSEKQVTDFNSLAREGCSLEDLFEIITDCLSPQRRPQKITNVEHPIRATIYLGNDLLQGAY